MTEWLDRAKEFALEKRNRAERIAELINEVADQDRLIESREAEILTDVCAEINPADGKARYSNEALRKAEVTMRSLVDQRLNDLIEARGQLRIKLENAKSDRDYAHDMHRAYVAAMNATRED